MCRYIVQDFRNDPNALQTCTVLVERIEGLLNELELQVSIIDASQHINQFVDGYFD
jgi:hypothetical protein